MKKWIIIFILILLIVPINVVYAGGSKDDSPSTPSEGEIINENTDKKLDCESLLGNPGIKNSPAYFLQKIFDVMKYIAIILVIVLTAFDFIGALSSKDDDMVKKVAGKFVTRFVICIVIFLVPTLLKFVFTLVKVYSPSVCGLS